jgi:hypothetical protein
MAKNKIEAKLRGIKPKEIKNKKTAKKGGLI